jgi:hypothetical protein
MFKDNANDAGEKKKEKKTDKNFQTILNFNQAMLAMLILIQNAIR